MALDQDHERPRRRFTARWAIALALPAGLAVGASQGCSAGPSESAGQAAEHPEALVGEAHQAATGSTSAPVCVSIRRLGASGLVADTQVADSAPTKNYATSWNMNTGLVSGSARKALLAFDLSQLPTGATVNVTSATLTLSQALAPSGAATVNVHRVLAPWAEGTVTAQSFANAFDATILGSFSNQPTTYTVDVKGLVSGWLRGTYQNYGLLLEQGGTFSSNYWTSDHPDVTKRPALDVCYTVTCAAGTADCNGNGADGCETDLGLSVTSCGACGQACVTPNAVPTCVGGACQVGSCNLGFGDCDGDAANGCETSLTTAQSCGACGVACAPAHASASCQSGTCTVLACDPGYGDCDGNPANGCEALPCAAGGKCATAADCASGVCAGSVCSAPSCADGVKNGGETAVDCGGPSCGPCAVGQGCAAAADCASSVCAGGACQAPTCSDGVKNAAETGVDCGGPSCVPCATGEACLVGTDCGTKVCTAGLCQDATCNDGLKNGQETGPDCGGPTCGPCAAGKGCGNGVDCLDGVCSGGVCQMAACNDGVKNGTESDVDCGGGACAPCGVASACNAARDCASDVCAGGFCQAPTCNDGVRNGNESGVDCGGDCYKPEACNGVDDDCNGQIDDGLGNVTCGLGACQVTVPACVAGQPQTCTPLAPSVEICDGLIDDDCDGVVDNGCACVNGQTQSCYTGSPWTIGVGVCAAGVQTCVHGEWGACVGEVLPGPETCDGQDNDCNGQADDGLGTIACGIGACQRIVPACEGGLAATCQPGDPTPEVCDGEDNDCNGVVDDDLPEVTCGTGACQVTVPSCVNGQAQQCTPLPPSAEVCDGIDNDCNGQIDEGAPGAGQACSTGLLGACASGTTACTAGQIVCNATTQPHAETCNGVDDDCDGVVDDNNPGGGQACSTGKLGACAAGTTVCSGGQLSCAQTTQPSPETCDGVDNDCNGAIDDGNPGGGAACSTGQAGACASGQSACQGGAVVCVRTQGPTAETCNGADDNCDGRVDEGCACIDGQTRSCYTGAAGTLGVGACHAGVQTCGGGQWGACVGEVLPAAESCDNVDNDCNGAVDDGLGTVSCGVGACGRTVPACVNGQANTCVPGAPSAETCNGLDDDCDGVIDNGNPGAGAACSTGKSGLCAAGTTACTAGALVCVQSHSPQPETCNGQDDDCDGQVDEGVTTAYYRDADGDGWGNATNAVQACAQPIGYVTKAGDCDDARFSVKPGAAEICNGLDDNCNGTADELVTTTFYRDADGDGYGVSTDTVQACSAPAGYAAAAGDCADEDPNKNPGIAEICNGLDDNCDGRVDEDDPSGGVACTTGLAGQCSGGTTHCVAGAVVCQQNLYVVWYEDLDDDNHGTTASTVQSCTQPAGYAPTADDCDDNDPDTYPGAPEVCDGVDNNCNGSIDENPVSPPTWYRDLDGDGYGTATPNVQQCAQPAGYASVAGDCNDSNANVSPASAEICDGLDNNCNGVADEGNPGGGAACTTGLLGVCSAGTTACVSGALICNQTNASGTEVCDGLDNDCDGVIDDGGVCNCVPGSTQSCYTGPGGTAGVGICKNGVQTCNAQGTGYGACTGQVLPLSYENCATAADDNCDGVAPVCSGAYTWAGKVGGTSSDVGWSVATDASGNVYHAGYFAGTVNFGGGNLVSAGSNDIFLRKVSPTGAFLWAKKFGSTGSDLGYGVTTDRAGNVILTGVFRGTVSFGGTSLVSNGASYYDVFVAKFDSAGNHLWSKKFGGTSNDYGYTVTTDAQNNVIVAGIFQGTANLGGANITSSGSYDMFLGKYDASGTHLWSKKIGGTSADYAYSVATDSNGNILLGGMFQGTVNFGGGNLVSAGSYDTFLAKYDANGNWVWAKKFGDANDNRIWSIAVDPSNNVLATGFFKGTLNFGGSALTSNGGTTYYDTFAVKLDNNGNHVWSKRFGGTAHEYGYGIAADAAGNVVLTGYFSGTTNLGGANLVSAGSYDVYVAKYDSAGNHLYSQKYGDASAQYGRGVAIDPSNNIVLTGYFAGSLSFGGGALTSAGSNDVYLAKLAP